MQYRRLGNTGIEVSALGFGAMRLPMDETDGRHVVREAESIAIIHRAFELGVNYIDTAHGYCYDQSQQVVGKALAGRRAEVCLSTKSPLWLIKRTEEFREHLDRQLQRLGVDYVDIYYFHGMSGGAYDKKTKPLKLVDEMRKARDEGLIRHIGFSSHGEPHDLARIVDEGWAEVILCQYNLLDRRNEQAMARAAQRGVGVAVMGPVGGGRLGVPSPKLQALVPGGVATTAELALRFVLANPSVSCALSGMGTMAMVEANAAAASRDGALTAAELERIRASMEQIKKLADLYCTGCDYCMPCPEGVKIPANFALMNLHRVYGLTDYARRAYRELREEARASHCAGCGQCEDRCPQDIRIREQLKEVDAVLGGPADREVEAAP